jgi:hypothetical protein
MQIDFEVAGVPASFRRNDMTGRAESQVGGEVQTIQSPYRLSTHFDIRTRIAWARRVGEHEIVIVRTRPRILGGIRANTFSISVDGVPVAEATGK